MPGAACCVASCSSTREGERAIRPPCLSACKLSLQIWTQWTLYMHIQMAPQLVVSIFLGLPLLFLSGLYTWIQTYQWMWVKVEAEMDDWLAYEDRCVWVHMHVCEYVYARVPCRVKHKTAAKPCYERRRAAAATHTFFVWLYGCMHSLTYAHEKEQHISHLRPSWGVWISGLLRVAGLSVCCSHGLIGATTGNTACT